MATREVELLRAACCIAGLDEEICANEMPLLERLAHHAGVGQASLGAMIDRARSDPNFYEEQFTVVRGDADSSIKVLLQVATANNTLTINERVVLSHFAEKLGMETERFEKYLAAAERKVEG